MKTINDTIILEDIYGGISPSFEGINYIDASVSNIHIPYRVLVRLYEIAKYDIQKTGIDWDKFCENLVNTKDI